MCVGGGGGGGGRDDGADDKCVILVVKMASRIHLAVHHLHSKDNLQ